MKTEGGFKYFFNGEEIENFDKFEKKIKDKDVKIEVRKLEVHARD